MDPSTILDSSETRLGRREERKKGAQRDGVLIAARAGAILLGENQAPRTKAAG
jgi:hypothetical protein